MKIIATIILLIMATTCHGKNLKQNKTITPIKMVSAAYELFTFTPETPRVVVVEKVTVNGRTIIMPINQKKLIKSVKYIKNNELELARETQGRKNLIKKMISEY